MWLALICRLQYPVESQEWEITLGVILVVGGTNGFFSPTNSLCTHSRSRCGVSRCPPCKMALFWGFQLKTEKELGLEKPRPVIPACRTCRMSHNPARFFRGQILSHPAWHGDELGWACDSPSFIGAGGKLFASQDQLFAHRLHCRKEL